MKIGHLPCDEPRRRFEAHYRKTHGNVPDYVFYRGLCNDRYFVLAVQLEWELWCEAIKQSGRDELLDACLHAKDILEITGKTDGELYEKLKSAIAKATA